MISGNWPEMLKPKAVCLCVLCSPRCNDNTLDISVYLRPKTVCLCVLCSPRCNDDTLDISVYLSSV